jgi:hypothetical protein
MVRWFRWLNQHGLLPGLVLLVLSVVLIAQDVLTLRTHEPGKQEKPDGTAPAPVPEWQEPVTVPIEDVERGAWERCWVVVRGVVAQDGNVGRDWVGISADGQKTRVLAVFPKRDFRRCQVGQVITVEGYQRGPVRGVVELLECRFKDPAPAGH